MNRMNSLVVAGLGLLLAVGTTIGIVAAANSSSADRVSTSSDAPVYGTP